MLSAFFRPKYRLIWCLFFIKVYHQPKLKREIVRIWKFQNKILYQSKKIPDTFSTSSKRLQDPKLKSRLCSNIFIISYQTLAQYMCQSSTPIHYMYNLHNILYKISYNSISKPCVEKKKKDIQWNILEIFHGTSICQLFLKIKYIPILRNVHAVCPMFQYRYSMSISSCMFHKDQTVHL